MNTTLRVLMVDDSEEEVRSISRELRRSGFSLFTRRVSDEVTLRAVLDSAPWDLVLCDASVLLCSAQCALAVLAECRVDVPLIVLSRRPVPSAAALDAVRRGARHFVSKGELWRLRSWLAMEFGTARPEPRLDTAASLAVSNVEEVAILRERLVDQQHWVALGRMAAGVAHDLNNILAVVLACAAPLENALDGDQPVREYVEEIERATLRGAALTHRVLALSQGRRSSAQLLNMNLVLDDLSKTLHRLVGADVEILVSSPLSLAPIRGDCGEIEQVILNLVVNARDAMPLGGRLTIAMSNVAPGAEHPALRQQVPHVLLSVTDTGVGIDPAIKERIFEPLFTTKGERGTGIGLSTVADVVQRCGGTICVDSDVGKGTTFRVYLPSAETIEDGPWTATLASDGGASASEAEV